MCRWSHIAGRLPGRTDNEIKNYWNTHIRRKLLSRGVDPSTHRPINGQAASDITISFKKEEKEDSFGCLEERNGGQKRPPRCPDLNLDLRISPPSYQDEPEPMKGERGLCFSCTLGLQKSKDCSCNGFLDLKTGLLDYRSLEMKWNGIGLCTRIEREEGKKMVLYLKTLYNMFSLSSICVINWNIIQVVTNICVFLSSSNPVCLEFFCLEMLWMAFGHWRKSWMFLPYVLILEFCENGCFWNFLCICC